MINTLLEIAQIENEELNKRMLSLLNVVMSDYVGLFGNLHPLMRELYSVLQTHDVSKTPLFLSHLRFPFREAINIGKSDGYEPN